MEACDFKGTAKIVKTNASTDGCFFPIALQNAAGFRVSIAAGMSVFAALLTLLILF